MSIIETVGLIELEPSELELIDGGGILNKFGEFVGYWTCVAYYTMVEALNGYNEWVEENNMPQGGSELAGRQWAYS